MTRQKVAVVQAGSVPFDAIATTDKAIELIGTCARNGAELVLFPEAFLGTYPKGLTFDAPIGTRLAPGREDFLTYFNGAVELRGEEVGRLVEASRDNGIFVVMGIIERKGYTLYCTVIYIDPIAGLLQCHRKLMPTAAERIVWGCGDGSTLPVHDTALGKVGAVICWENYMPLLRMAMYQQGVEIYCAPTADDRDSWLATIRHIALEGRCYVLSACQYIERRAFPEDYRGVLGDSPETALMKGGSVIVGPLGQIMAGPALEGEAILYADVDREELVRSKLDFDPVGHYARPDIFTLVVNEGANCPVVFDTKRNGSGAGS